MIEKKIIETNHYYVNYNFFILNIHNIFSYIYTSTYTKILLKLINKNPVIKQKLKIQMRTAKHFSKENPLSFDRRIKNNAGNITDKKLLAVEPLKLSILIIFSEVYPTKIIII